MRVRLPLLVRECDGIGIRGSLKNFILWVRVPPFLRSKKWDRGEIGRRSALKMRNLTVWGFKSLRSYCWNHLARSYTNQVFGYKTRLIEVVTELAYVFVLETKF